MSHIIDRRLNPRGKNHGNRQRFIRRARDQIKRSVQESIQNKNIKDITSGDKVKVPVRDLNEPTFGNSSKGGVRETVHPGNKDFVEKDQVRKPQGGGQGQGGREAGQGDGEDEFTFTLSREEFLDFFFEDLELPDLVKQKLKEIKAEKPKRAGYTTSGNPSSLDVKQSMKHAMARRIALKRPSSEEIEELERQLEDARKRDAMLTYAEIELKIAEAKRRTKAIPWFDPVDVRYRQFVPQPQPIAQACMVCIMDVSGSMGEREKDLAKRFFMLLYLFLERKYEKVDLVFIRHTDKADEVDEHTFFYDRFSGGTIVSTGLKKAVEVIKDRYPADEWNLYCAQVSDGENWGGDSEVCEQVLREDLMPLLQYMAYIEIMDRNAQYSFSYAGSGSAGDLWKHYENVAGEWKNLAMKRIAERRDIFPVFRELFSKENA